MVYDECDVFYVYIYIFVCYELTDVLNNEIRSHVPYYPSMRTHVDYNFAPYENIEEDEEFEIYETKINKRITRFFKMLETAKKIWFVRIYEIEQNRTFHNNHVSEMDELPKFIDYLKEQYPDLDVNVLLITDEEHQINHPNVHNYVYDDFKTLTWENTYVNVGANAMAKLHELTNNFYVTPHN